MENQTYSKGRGGKRSGAGRKIGAVTKKTQKIAEKAASEGISPLEYMLGVMRDVENDDIVRFEAAKASAPYIHPRLAAVEHSGPGGEPIPVQVYLPVNGR